MFDAQCDFAAVAYGLHDDPDRLLLQFANDLRRSGCRVAGFVQRGVHPLEAAGSNADFGAVLLSGPEIVSLGHYRDHDAHCCEIDAERLAAIGRAIAQAVEEGVDLVILNRFGKLEAQGRGLIQLIGQAIAADIPVVTAVPEHRFAAWVRYSDGMSVRLPCYRAALDAWWQSVTGQAGDRAAGGFCATVK
jgi:nucleoside-triphosphatase THEP1